MFDYETICLPFGRIEGRHFWSIDNGNVRIDDTAKQSERIEAMGRGESDAYHDSFSDCRRSMKSIHPIAFDHFRSDCYSRGNRRQF